MGNLFLAVSDEHKHFNKFNKCRSNTSIVETSENTKKTEKPKNKLITELQPSLDKIKKIKVIQMLSIGMFKIHLDCPIVTITIRPFHTDVLHVNNIIKNVNIIIFVVEVNIFRSVV